ncbi:HlyD family secretion protein [Sinosporangium album]|uniref:HlyD family secretion protein n=1 Tax=Sinosporangium album TaxID=504805 RepID=A0A1G8HWA8_9ACTN|nr:efflux RND transporter periplasmic adaptor subunit [Sinosporangium album]SDI10887.1 HlyD family secretion protein [Sinosporangium album]
MSRFGARTGVLAVVVAVTVGGGAYLTLRDEPAETSSVRLASAERGTVTSAVSAAGSTADGSRRELAFGSSGKVTRLYVKAGDKVRRGELLARIDSTAAQEAYTQARADYVAAKEALEEPSPAEETSPAAGDPCVPAPKPKASASASRSPMPSPSPSASGSASPRPSTASSSMIGAAGGPAVRAAAHRLDPIRETQAPSPQKPGEEPSAELSVEPVPTVTVTVTATATVTAAVTRSPGPSRPAGISKSASPGAGADRTAADSCPASRARPSASAETASAGAADRLESQLRAAQADLSKAQDQLDGTKIVAPVSGTILSVAGKAGETARTGTFLTLGNLDELQVKAEFTESDVNQLKIGQKAAITLATSPETRHTGTVTRISPTATTTGQLVTYTATISFDKPPRKLMVGQTASVVVTLEEAEGAIYLPVQAVTGRPDGTAVVRLRDGGEKSVRTGVRGDQYVQITQGLSEKDLVVVSDAASGEFPDSGWPE